MQLERCQLVIPPPHASAGLKSTGRMEVVQFSDFVTTRKLHNLEVYQQFCCIERSEPILTENLTGRSLSGSLTAG
jgi:hypothetical protein